MTPEDRSYITRLFARCIAFAFVFMLVAMVCGLIAARILGIAVESDKIWGILGSNFTLIAAAALGFLSTGSKADKDV